MDRIKQVEENLIEDLEYAGNGEWLCHDTGIVYRNADIDRMLAPSRVPAKPVSKAVKDARASLSGLGYRALVGTPRQKEWAEKIRKAAVDALPESMKSGLILQTKAAWFIDNRDSRTVFVDTARRCAAAAAVELERRKIEKEEAAAVGQQKRKDTKTKKSLEASPAFARIRSVIGGDAEKCAAIFRPYCLDEAKYEKIAALSDEDLLAFADATVVHSKINSNDQKWHAMKEEIVARFGFRR